MTISIPWLHKHRARAGRVGIAVGPDGLRAACVDGNGLVTFCHAETEPGDLAYIVNDLVEQQSWQDMPCSIVLHPLYYQLLLTEAPAVQDNEMTSAVRWRIKDLLDFSVEQAAIEYFKLPEDAYRGRKKMLYAAAMRKSVLQELVEPIEECGLAVDCIEIAELALNNVFARRPSSGEGSALVHLLDGEGLINLSEEGAVYLCRRLDIGMDRFAGGSAPAFFESLLLEIQRSLDFYESQLGKGIVSQLYYSPSLPETSVIGEYLSAQLGLIVEPLQLNDLLTEQVDANTAVQCVTAIGAALGPVNSVTNDVEASVAAH